MPLSRFSIFVRIDSSHGISKDGVIPWNLRSDLEYFRATTIGNGNNAIIMGRVTYDTIPEEAKPLEGRTCIVISQKWRQEDNHKIIVSSSLLEALITAGGKRFDEVFIIGGEQIYTQAITRYMYLCNKIFITKLKASYDCDQFFQWDEVCNFPLFKNPTITRDYTRHIFCPDIVHDEGRYLKLLEHVSEKGEPKTSENGYTTLSTFGDQLSFDIGDAIPLVTTKQILVDSIIKELLMFVSGKTDTKILEEQGVMKWKEKTSEQTLKNKNLKFEEGDMGANYPHQFRHYSAEYKGCDESYENEGIDQLSNVIKSLRDEPHSNKHILSVWNVEQLEDMVDLPEVLSIQFNVSSDRKYLDCCVTSRLSNVFTDVPVGVAIYSFLTYILCHITNLKPRKLIYNLGNAFVYTNHKMQIRKQLKRTPHPFATLRFRKGTKLREIDDFDFDSFIVEGYTSWPQISEVFQK
ncbi:thymidylate synthase [bacterium]|nr:thymidylate synthase [bacterium]